MNENDHKLLLIHLYELKPRVDYIVDFVAEFEDLKVSKTHEFRTLNRHISEFVFSVSGGFPHHSDSDVFRII